MDKSLERRIGLVAISVSYDNTVSGLAALEVQSAIDELSSLVAGSNEWSEVLANGNISDGNNVIVSAGDAFSIVDLTTGSVPFAGAVGVFTQDNTNLFWDNAAKEFGIGTNSPGGRTHIKGTGSTSGTFSLIVENSSGSPIFRTRDDQSASFFSTTLRKDFNVFGTSWLNEDVTLNASQTTNGASIEWRTSAAPSGTILSAIAGDDETNQKLVFFLNRSGTSGRVMTLQREDSTDKRFVLIGAEFTGNFDATLSVKGITSDSTDNVLNILDSSDAVLFRVRNDGNVGIGTSTPNTLLELDAATTVKQSFYNSAAFAVGNLSQIDFAFNNDAATRVVAASIVARAEVVTAASEETGIGINDLTMHGNGRVILALGSLTIPALGKLHITGEGGDASTKSLYVEDSAGSLYMEVNDAGQMGLGTAGVAASALLEMISTTQGFLLPRMTETQRDAITPAEALIIYNTTTNQWEGWNGTVWAVLG